MLLRKFALCSYDVKRQLFISYCTNVYCVQLWNDFELAQVHKLRVANNYYFRYLFRLPARRSTSEMFVYNEVPTCYCGRVYIVSMGQRLKRSENSILRDISFKLSDYKTDGTLY